MTDIEYKNMTLVVNGRDGLDSPEAMIERMAWLNKYNGYYIGHNEDKNDNGVMFFTPEDAVAYKIRFGL